MSPLARLLPVIWNIFAGIGFAVVIYAASLAWAVMP